MSVLKRANRLALIVKSKSKPFIFRRGIWKFRSNQAQRFINDFYWKNRRQDMKGVRQRQQFLQSPNGAYLPSKENRQAVANIHCLCKCLMGQDNGLSVIRKFLHDADDFIARCRVKIREWLIQQKKVRLFDQQACNSNVIWEPGQRLNTGDNPPLQQPAQANRLRLTVCLRQVANPPPNRGTTGRTAKDLYRPIARTKLTRQQFQCRRFAAALGANQSKNRSAMNFQANTRQGETNETIVSDADAS